MSKILKGFAVFIAIVAITISCFIVCNPKPNFDNNTFIGNVNTTSLIGQIAPIDMPIEINPQFATVYSFDPEPQRGQEFRRYLSPSIKVSTNKASGSATIVAYDGSTNTAWAISCGHLWNPGTSRQPKDVTLIVFYHNEHKLEQPRQYKGTVHFHHFFKDKDISLISFHPDWQPDYFPVAPEGYNIVVGQRYHSTGCDRGSEVAHYDVELYQNNEGSYVTRDNSPRPGRSGGGLLTSDGFHIGICVRTSDTSGNGVGAFIKHETIVNTLKAEGYTNLLNRTPYSWIRFIPIIDMNNPQGQYDPNYIPLPDNF